MSAIAGIVSHHHNHRDLNGIHPMMESLERYPADDQRIWQGDTAAFGCLAQWVTPESVHERLPFYDPESKLAITADAILDNRNELLSRLRVGISHKELLTDSDLILLAYRKWGMEAPNYLIGDFTFMIWDEEKKLLFGARDLFGNRTLYFDQNHERFAFCTTIAPLQALPGAAKELNQMWLAEFLAIPVMVESTDTFSTVYKQIRQLPPAHTITVMNGNVTMSRYGSVIPEEKLILKSDEEYEEAFRDIFDLAIRSSVRSMGQVGAKLSGGLDSGTIASFASGSLAEENKTLQTYSYVPVSDFQDWTSRGRLANEREYIQETVRHVGNINSHLLEFPGRSPISEVDPWLDLLEMPYKYFENSFWIRGIYETAAQQGVRVMLTGARGNQTISWGPAIHYYTMLLKKLKWLQFYRELHMFSQRRGIGRSYLMRVIGKQAMPFLAEQSLATGESDLPRMISPEFARKTKVIERLSEHDEALSGFLKRDYTEARESHLQSLLIANLRGTKGTRLSLNYSIWERDPTCDPRVVRFCLSVPIEQYVKNGMDRALIRRATKGLLPDKVRLNQRIRGVQGADWVHRMLPVWKPFKDEVQELCSSPIGAEYLNVDAIRSALVKVGDTPRPDEAFDPEIRLLMRSVIIHRFLNRL
ncbi:asparagine synthase-related protein [Paenibacillus nasutitermitis]|uniref:asparagine synthase (glutamine-hydrolyzing) n=1 Tax=Paenibacillus nasutitermitis TaxID=1652958 RepID=A0A916Z4Q2_9BACL|nr:asparagine synthase-related protein [Paenibacillus nasutitermitis]GGD76123.1 asparagine synthetase B [Paenibacillus nasutitermitis]